MRSLCASTVDLIDRTGARIFDSPDVFLAVLSKFHRAHGQDSRKCGGKSRPGRRVQVLAGQCVKVRF